MCGTAPCVRATHAWRWCVVRHEEARAMARCAHLVHANAKPVSAGLGHRFLTRASDASAKTRNVAGRHGACVVAPRVTDVGEDRRRFPIVQRTEEGRHAKWSRV